MKRKERRHRRGQTRDAAPGRRGRAQGRVLAWSTAIGLVMTVASFAVMGSPPAIGIDSLWVHAHRDAVRLCLTGEALAIAMTLIAVIARRGRTIIALLWAVAIAIIAVLFSDRVGVVATVLRDRLW